MVQDITPVVETLQEYASSAGLALRVDREKCMVYGVKVLGLHSKNDGGKRTYSPKATSEGLSLYEGAAVFVDHQKGPGPRSYRDRNGRLTNPRCLNGEIFADHAYNPKHPVTEQYLEDAEHAPGNVGFSHDVEGTVSRKDGQVIVESIVKVNSVDLVARPATTRGLFENEELPADPIQRELCEHGLSAVSDARTILLGEESPETKKTRLLEVLAVWRAELAGGTQPVQETPTMEWKDITAESLKENRKDLIEVLTGTDSTSKLTAEVTALTEAITVKDAALKEATDRMTAIEAEREKQAKAIAVAEELKAAKVNVADKAVCTDAIMAQLSEAKDTVSRKPIIDLMVLAQKTAVREFAGSAPLGSVGGSGGGDKRTIQDRLR